MRPFLSNSQFSFPYERNRCPLSSRHSQANRTAGGTVMKVDERHDDEETDGQVGMPSYLNSVSMPVTMW